MNELQNTSKTKFCKHCGNKIPEDAVICTACGRQVEEIKKTSETPNIIINNENKSTNINANVNANMNNTYGLKMCNKWVSLMLCLFLGFLGAHKFYEGKAGMGIIYLCTGGLLLVGVVIDFLAILAKPNPYCVR